MPLSDISEVNLMQDASWSASFGPNVGHQERDVDEDKKDKSLFKTNSIAKSFKALRSSTGGSNEGIAMTLTSNNLLIVTEEGGYNSGRKYYIQTNSDSERREIADLLTVKFKAAKKSQEIKSRHKRMKENILRITSSNPFQYFFAMLIFAVSSSVPHGFH